MSAAVSIMSPAWFIVFVVLSLRVPGASSSSAAGTDVSPQCVDGTYKHSGMTCCLCAAGQHLEEHCLTNLTRGKCKACDPGRYSSHANDLESCEPCTSCSQPNANLEVDQPCTRARNTKCRCKKDHYCSDGTEPCRICYPCNECGAEGIKVSCTANNNTVCNEKNEGGSNTGMIVGITVPVLLTFIGLLALAFIWKKRRDRNRQEPPAPLTNGADVEMQPLQVVDLQPHLPAIAGEIGWKDMQEIAMRSGMPNTTIESCQLNHPGDAQEQTLELLKIWTEREGREASRKLVQILEKSGKKAKAENVTDMLFK